MNPSPEAKEGEFAMRGQDLVECPLVQYWFDLYCYYDYYDVIIDITEQHFAVIMLFVYTKLILCTCASYQNELCTITYS